MSCDETTDFKQDEPCIDHKNTSNIFTFDLGYINDIKNIHCHKSETKLLLIADILGKIEKSQSSFTWWSMEAIERRVYCLQLTNPTACTRLSIKKLHSWQLVIWKTIGKANFEGQFLKITFPEKLLPS